MRGAMPSLSIQLYLFIIGSNVHTANIIRHLFVTAAAEFKRQKKEVFCLGIVCL
jgi:hypothetical protein